MSITSKELDRKIDRGIDYLKKQREERTWEYLLNADMVDIMIKFFEVMKGGDDG